jgi:glycosyltransferase involved in cell wall biosynthesis
MRSELISVAASIDFRLKILVVPVVGPGRVQPGREISVLPLPGPRQLAAQAAALMASATWRGRISRTYPLPWLATLAPATLAAAAEQILGPAPGTPVHVARSYLAPLGIALAERIGSAWLTLDLDDDDEGLARTAGDEATGAAYGRLVAEFGPLFSGVALAAPAEATAVSARHGLTTTVLPNAITGPGCLRPGSPGPGGLILPRPRGGEGAVELLFVGNLTYWANADAAVRLVRDVLPRVRRLTGRTVRVTLAGDAGHDRELESLAREPGVRLTGFVPDVGPVYDRADMLVAPLRFAAGTRIKLLEAFSRGVPVVTTAAGAAGLEVISGQHLLIADPAGEMAQAVVRLAGDDELRARLTAGARDLVQRNYSRAAVVPRIREFFAAAAGRPELTAASRIGYRFH